MSRTYGSETAAYLTGNELVTLLSPYVKAGFGIMIDGSLQYSWRN